MSGVEAVEFEKGIIYSLSTETPMELYCHTVPLFPLDRTFPTHKMFMEGSSMGKEGRAALFRILAVYILYNPQVSYCQGMCISKKLVRMGHVEHIKQNDELQDNLVTLILHG